MGEPLNRRDFLRRAGLPAVGAALGLGLGNGGATAHAQTPIKRAGGARLKTSRGEEAMSGTVVNSGVTIAGQLILSGAREGQFIDPKSDKAWILFDPQDGGKIDVSPIGGPASGWPSLTLELCPGSRA